MSQKMRSWCFTLNNFTDDELDIVDGWSMDSCEATKRLVVCNEVGEEKTPHLQGYVTWNVSRRLSALKKLLPRAHWAVAKGNAQENYKYCTKCVDGASFFREKGDFAVTAGSRSDIARAREMMNSNASIAEVWQTIDSYQAVRFAQIGQSFTGLQRSWKPDVYWFYGPTGSGKTRTAFDLDPSAYWATGTQWWDGYSSQEAVIIDDFRSDSYSFEFLLRLLDRYPLKVPYKGGYAPFLAKRIYITTPWKPEDTFASSMEDIEQLKRRIKEVREFSVDKD